MSDKEFSAWDPMKDDYNSENNVYDTGPGSRMPRSAQPAMAREGERNMYKLYVFPVDKINKNMLRNIFSECGEVSDVIHHEGTRYAFVVFTNESDAAEAIKKFHKHPELKFKVDYATERARNGTNADQHTPLRHNHKPKFGDDGKKATRNSSGYESDYSSVKKWPSMTQKSRRSGYESDFSVPSMPDGPLNGDNSLTNGRNYNGVNNEHSKPSFGDSRKETYRTSGCESDFSTKLPNMAFPTDIFPIPARNIEESKMLPVTMENCLYCTQKTTSKCSVCRLPFCCDNCQLAGYNHHRKCITKPSLFAIPATPPTSSSDVRVSHSSDRSILAHFETAENDYTQSHVTSGTAGTRNSLQHKCEPIKSLLEIDFPERDALRFKPKSQTNTYSKNMNGEKKFQVKNEPTKDNSLMSRIKREQTNDSNLMSRIKNEQTNDSSPMSRNKNEQTNDNSLMSRVKNEPTSDNGFTSRIKSELSNTNDLNESTNESDSKITAQIQNYKRQKAEIKENVPIKVKLRSWFQPSSYYVHLENEKELLKMLMDDLNNSCDDFKSLDLGNKKCAVLKGDTWYRGLVVEKSPLKVKIVDFGVTEQCAPNALKALPSQFLAVPPLAYQIEFINFDDDQLQDWKRESKVIDILPTEQRNRIWIAKVLNMDNVHRTVLENVKSDPVDVPNSINPAAPLASIESSFKKLEKAIPECTGPVIPKEEKSIEKEVIVVYPVSEREYTVSELDVMKDMPAYVAQFTAFKSYKKLQNASVDMMCIARYESSFWRTKITKVDPLTLYFLDYGNTDEIDPDDVFAVPDELKELFSRPHFVFHIVLNKEEELEEGIAITIKKLPGETTWKLLSQREIEDESADSETSTAKAFSPDETKNAPTKRTKLESITVIVLMKRDSEVGVITKENYDKMMNVTKELEKSRKILEPVKYPKTKKLYISTYDEALVRVRVVRVLPLILYFVDYGFQQTNNFNSLFHFPETMESLMNLEDLAIKIRLEDPENANPGDVVEIQKDPRSKRWTVASMLDKVSDPEEWETDSKTTELIPDPAKKVLQISAAVSQNALRRKSPIDFEPFVKRNVCNVLKKGDNGNFKSEKMYNSRTFSGMLLCSRLNSELIALNELQNIEQYETCRSSPGDIVAAWVVEDDNDMIFRGCVIQATMGRTLKHRVALIDRSVIVDVENVAPLPEEFDCEHVFAVRCFVVVDNYFVLSDYQTLCFEVIDDKQTVHMWPEGDKSYDYATVRLEAWEPSLEEIVELKQISVKAGDEVMVTEFLRTDKCYVMLGDMHWLSKRVDVINSVNLHCLNNAPALNRDPFKGELVGVFYNEAYYRGQLEEINQNNKYTMRLVDLGQTVDVGMSDLKKLDVSIKMYIKCTLLVGLKSVPHTDFPMKAKRFTEKMIFNKWKLKVLNDDCTALDLNFIDTTEEEEELTENFNKHLSSLLTPSWKKNELPPQKFMIQCMAYEEWEVGSIRQLVPYHYLFDELLMVADESSDNFKSFMNANLQERMNEYCTECPNAYLPTENEVCLAAHGNWCRAVCLSVKSGEDPCLLLLDVGDFVTVSNKLIRRMVHDFIYYAPLTMKCYVTGLMASGVDGVKLCDKKPKMCKILSKEDVDEYYIEIITLSAYKDT